MNSNDKPLWNPAAKSASIRKWAEHLHKESMRVFLADKTHAHIIFLFTDDGPVSVTPVPPKSDHAQIHRAISDAVQKNNLYAVIHVGEAWAYFPKEKDHIAFQLMDGEMKVSDLKPEDKSEALYLRMESRDKDCVIYLNRIIRNGDKVELAEGKTMQNEERKWFLQ